MFLAASNKTRNLLHLSYVGRVTPADLSDSLADVKALLSDLCTGFWLLTDMSQMEVMDAACERHMGRIMDLCKAHGVGRIIRVIPDPTKDIGLNILTRFHYGRGARVTTCKSLEQAGKLISR